MPGWRWPLFSSPSVNFIQNDDGYSIRILGRTGLEYREGHKVMSVDSEVLMSKDAAIAIWKQTIQAWHWPHDHDQVSESKREEIVRNIRAALAWNGTRLEVL